MRRAGARATITPIDRLSFTLKGGDSLRKTSWFNAATLPLEENSSIYQYDYAPRDRVFYTLTGAWTATSTSSPGRSRGRSAKDDYRSSLLGLLGTHEQRRLDHPHLDAAGHDGAPMSTPATNGCSTLQNGYAGVATTPWLATDTERSWNVGLGGRWVPQERWTLTLDYLLAPSYDDTRYHGGRLGVAAGVSAELEQTRLLALRGRLQLDRRGADPFSVQSASSSIPTTGRSPAWEPRRCRTIWLSGSNLIATT